MRFLCVADVHGHVEPLRAVMEAARLRGGFDKLVAVGDLLFPGPAPLATWQLLVEHQALCVQGASDRALAELALDRLRPASEQERARVERLRATRQELGELIVARLARLEPIVHLPVEDGSTLAFVHGSPVDPLEPITHDLDDGEVGALLGTDGSDVFVCGGGHVPFQRRLGEVVLVAPGSVGEPATRGVASAALLESTPFGVEILPFDVEL